MIPNEFPPFVYEISSISKLFWREFAITFQQNELFERGDRLPGFSSFTAEIFHRLYYEPDPKKLELSPPESEWAENLHDGFSEIIGFENLVQLCVGNQLAAGLATKEFCSEILNKLPQLQYKLQDPQKLRELIKRLKNNPNRHPRQTLNEFFLPQQRQLLQKKTPEPMTRQKQMDKEDMKKIIELADDDIEELIEKLRHMGLNAVEDAQQYALSLDESQIRQTLRVALAQTEEKLEDAAKWLEMMNLSWGASEGTEQTVSPVEKMKLVQRIAANNKLKQIAKIAGRLKDIADRKRRTKSNDAFGELSTIEPGNNLARLLPCELQKLAEPALFPLFALGYYEHSLLQYKIVGKEKKSKGPLVVCLDSSGSMKGLPDTWAKAVTAVLLQIAQKDNRHFRVIHFDTKVRRTDDFPDIHHDRNKLLESLLSFYSGGGTNWEPVLDKAIKYIDEDKSLNKADVVMITDALCDISKEFLDKLKQQKEQRELNILSILIGHRSEKPLAKFSDRIWAIKDLNAEIDTQIEELFLI